MRGLCVLVSARSTGELKSFGYIAGMQIRAWQAVPLTLLPLLFSFVGCGNDGGDVFPQQAGAAGSAGHSPNGGSAGTAGAANGGSINQAGIGGLGGDTGSGGVFNAGSGGSDNEAGSAGLVNQAGSASGGVSGSGAGGAAAGDGGTSNGGSSNAGAPNGGTGGEARCLRPYEQHTLQTLKEASNEGACHNDADFAAVCATDLVTVAATCTLRCRRAKQPDKPCVDLCIQEVAKPATSNACTVCYREVSTCIGDNCASACLTAPASKTCRNCRIKNGCSQGFMTCSGLPDPN
jgi:hypothetical protein